MYKAYRGVPNTELLVDPRNPTAYSSFFSSPTDSFLSVKPQPNCRKCATSQNNPYLDLLKYELAKRIELQVAKGNLDNKEIYSWLR